MAPNGSRGFESLPVMLIAHLSLESSLTSSKIKSTGFSKSTANLSSYRQKANACANMTNEPFKLHFINMIFDAVRTDT